MDVSHKTPLHWAKDMGPEDVLHKPLEAGADHTIVDQDGRTILVKAVMRCLASISQRVLGHDLRARMKVDIRLYVVKQVSILTRLISVGEDLGIMPRQRSPTPNLKKSWRRLHPNKQPPNGNRRVSPVTLATRLPTYG